MSTLEHILVPGLVFLAVFMIGGAVMASRMARRRAISPRLYDPKEEINAAMSDAPTAGVSFLSRLGAAVSFGGTTERLQKTLVSAGYHNASAVQVFLGCKILLLAVGVVGGFAALIPVDVPVPLKIVAGFFAGGVLSFIPNFAVEIKRQSRSAEVRRFLPDATDLLEICVSAGMGLDMAWNAVTDEVRRVSGVLADEMALANLEIQLGSSRPVAMRRMAERTNAPEITSLVAVLIQSDRFGTSIGDALRAFAQTMREERSQRAEETAEKMAVKLLFPMVILIFPAALIVMVGPAAIRLTALLGSK
jgi:tight adherence protein C